MNTSNYIVSIVGLGLVGLYAVIFSSSRLIKVTKEMEHYKKMCLINEMKILLAEDTLKNNIDVMNEMMERLDEKTHIFKEEA